MVVLTEKQQKIFEWLDNKLQLPLFADAYKGAVNLLKKKPPGYVTFVSHIGRDIMNLLAKTVAGITGGRTQYVQLVDGLQKEWQEEWRGKGLTSPQHQGEGHLIPYHVCEVISNLITEHEEGRRRSQEADDYFFNIFLGDSDKDRIPNLNKWKEAKDFFMGSTHLRVERFSLEAPSKLAQNFKMLEEFLYIAATSEYSRIRILDAILEEAQN